MADKKGAIAKRLITIRNDIRAAEEIVKKHKEKYDNLAEELMNMMRDDDVTVVGNDIAGASIVGTKVAQVTDWEKFYRFISRNKAFYLLQKRVADKVYRELLEDRRGRDIPGTVPFTKYRLNLRTGKK